MRVLQLSTFDGRFGAAIAARRLHEALLTGGHESDLLVGEVLGDFPRTHGPRSGFQKFMGKARHRLDAAPLKLYPHRELYSFSPNWVPSNLPERVAQFQSNVVHLHWCQSDFVPTPTLPRLGRPLVWTFHDMWAFTGGCHYTAGCEGYLSGCGRCPVLGSRTLSDLSRRLWKQKQRVYRQIRKSLQVICPSNWLSEVARRAPLMEDIPVHTVPNPINTKIFKPVDKFAARRLLGLPEKGRLLLWAATLKNDRRKGFDLLEEALVKFGALPDAPALEVVTIGMKNSSASESGNLPRWNMGFLQDEVSLCALYNAVDVVALPSREENLSNTLAEALCCGTTCLAFDIGGNGDLISHRENGYLAKAGDSADMAAGLAWILLNLDKMQRNAVADKAQKQLAEENLMPRFLEIYQAALAQ